VSQETSKAFFSYSREDSAFALRLGRDLRDAGAPVWLDQIDIEPGQRWDRSVEKALGLCTQMLIILSPSSIASDNVMDEVSYALERNIFIIPVLYRDCDIPFRLRRLQYIDFRSDYQQGLKTIVPILASEVHPAAAAELGEQTANTKSEVTRPFVTVARKASRLKPKVCLVGADGVGKTSLVRRFIQSIFSASYLTTVGVKIDKKIVTIGESEVTMMIWDIAGEEASAPINMNHVRDARGLILVADGCRSFTLETALNLRTRIHDKIGRCPTILAVNKVDLHGEWEIKMEALETLGRDGLDTFTTSAKTGKGVEELFTHLARLLVEMQEEAEE
jgi:small GTP-binding protein